MPRLGYMIVDGLALVMAGVSLTAVVVGYERNLPDPASQLVQVSGSDEDWLDPVTTGAITPKTKATAVRSAASEADATMEEPALSTSAGGRAWVDPPRHSNAGRQSEPTIDQATGLRMPRS